MNKHYFLPDGNHLPSFLLQKSFLLTALFALLLCYTQATHAQDKQVWDDEHGWLANNFFAPEGYTLEQAVADADVVFEGVVTGIKVFRGTLNHDSTYTINSINVTKVFKGKVGKKTTLLAKGGFLLDEVQPDGIAPGSIGGGMPVGATGIFLVKKNTTRVFKGQLSNLVSAQFRMLEYAGQTIEIYYGEMRILQQRNNASNNLLNEEIEERFYKRIERSTGKKSKTYKPILAKPKKNAAAQKSQDSEASVIIQSLIPLSVPAGLMSDSSLLTIVGTGFGPDTGSVEFKNRVNTSYFEAPRKHIQK